MTAGRSVPQQVSGGVTRPSQASGTAEDTKKRVLGRRSAPGPPPALCTTPTHPYSRPRPKIVRLFRIYLLYYYWFHLAVESANCVAVCCALSQRQRIQNQFRRRQTHGQPPAVDELVCQPEHVHHHVGSPCTDVGTARTGPHQTATAASKAKIWSACS